MTRPDPVEPPDPMVDGTVLAVLAAAAILSFVVAVALIVNGA